MIAKVLSLTVGAIIVLIGSAEAKTYPFCKDSQYTPNNANCNKFAFGSDGSAPCIDPKNGTTFYDLSGYPAGSLDANTEKMALLTTTVFENGVKVPGYGYAENLPDGRGWTAGYIGFTTGTNDAYAMISDYTKKNPNNALAQYLPVLKDISALPFCDKRRGDVSKLPNYKKSWETEACKSDSAFRDAQRAYGRKIYMIPATRYAAAAGLKSNLGKLVFYDTIIQHGWQYTEPKINLPRIISLTGPKSSGESEQAYLQRFLVTRRQLQCCFPDTVWPESADRTSDLQDLVKNYAANKDLKKPIKLTQYSQTITGKENIDRDTENC